MIIKRFDFLRAYVMNELTRVISVLDIGDEGTLSLKKNYGYHVEGEMEDDVLTGAEIYLTPDGKTLYASVRNSNRAGAMLVFTVHGVFEQTPSVNLSRYFP